MAERAGTTRFASYFATCPTGVADLLARELRACGATSLRELRAGVAFEGTLETAYRACLWSRTASRILLRLGEVPAATPDQLYAGMRAIDWSRHMRAAGSIAIDVVGTNAALKHTRFTAQRAKDAIVDAFRAASGERPRVDLAAPDLRINLRVRDDAATVGIDLAGESLHRRGYRASQLAAPLKENLAAAMLLRSGWPKIASAGGAFVDPMCGSGTLVIEAALIARRIAPGLIRQSFGFERWLGHDAMLFARLVSEARTARDANAAIELGDVLRGYDRDPRAINAAIENAGRAGVLQSVHFERRELAQLPAPRGSQGLLATNPPYGERIGDRAALEELYALLGARLREDFIGWEAALLTGDPPLARFTGLRARRSHTLWNGPIECRLLRFAIDPVHFEAHKRQARLEDELSAARARPGAAMFANRLRKNRQTIGRWADREGIDCYRLYDADMPEYAFAIDLYGDGVERWAYLQEYEPPASIEPIAARRRRLEVRSVLPEVLDIAPEQIHERIRRPQKGGAQYQKVSAERVFHAVREQPQRFLVNFTDYLDTGLFLDHRPMRRRIREEAAGRRFLNLFGYTGTMTVCAAAGGARRTTTVDLSGTYLDWARRNIDLNGLAGGVHALVQADCLDWLDEAARSGAERFELIFLDPPTYSRSKRMEHDFDIQRDHARLITQAMTLLASEGVLYFSCNFSRFKLGAEVSRSFRVTDVTRTTIPRDFERNPRVHVCFEIRH